MFSKYKEVWIPFICFILIVLLLLLNIATPIDLWVYHKIEPLIQNNLTGIMKFFTFLGEPKTIIIFSLIWIIYLFFKNKKEIKPFLFLILLSGLSMLILKFIFTRERPNILRLIEITGYSFPSGHSIISMSFYSYFATVLLEHNWSKTIVVSITICIIIGIGFSRIYLGVHYFTDVLAGYSIGALLLSICNLMRRKEQIQ